MYEYEVIRRIKNSKTNKVRIFINRILRRDVLKLEMEVVVKTMPTFHPNCRSTIFPAETEREGE